MREHLIYLVFDNLLRGFKQAVQLASGRKGVAEEELDSWTTGGCLRSRLDRRGELEPFKR